MAHLNREFMAQFRAARPSVPKVLAWIAALRSGQYEQAHGSFSTNTGCLCCLAVLATIDRTVADGTGWARFQADLGFENSLDFQSFVNANDEDRWTFNQIADWLEVAINLQRTIDLLSNLPDERFGMRAWRSGDNHMADARLLHDCGTAACIAGWAAVYATSDGHISIRAAEALGLTNEQAMRLFEPPNLNRSRSEAVQVLEHFRDTGEITWP